MKSKKNLTKHIAVALTAGLLATGAAAPTTVHAKTHVDNILLIGQDSQVGERERSDCMILVSLNEDKNTFSMVSFMRDMYVNIPDHGSTRINAAYAYGGMELLDRTITENFGIEIDGNVEVDFESFTTVIDSLGGVNIYLTQEEADYIVGRSTDVLYPQPYRADWENLQEGYNILNGEQALVHSRNRSLGNDYARTDRQRQVLTALMEKAMECNTLEMLDLARKIFPLVKTDLGLLKILSLVKTGLTLDLSEIHSYRIPAEGTYVSDNIDGMAVLIPDLQANQQYLQEILY